MKNAGLLCLILIGAGPARADLALPLINPTELNEIAADFGATFSHSSVSGASTLGEYFGFEIGAIGGINYTPNLYRLANESAPNSDLRYLPHLNTYIAFSMPMALKAEVTFLPQVTDYGTTVESYSGALSWNLSDTVLPLPFELAVRIFESLALTKFSESISGVNESVQISSINQGIDAIASINLGLIEPYIAIGGIKTYCSVKLGGPNSIFTFTSDLNASAEVLGFEALAGVDLRYGHGVIGVEVGDVFNDVRALTKLSAVF